MPILNILVPQPNFLSMYMYLSTSALYRSKFVSWIIIQLRDQWRLPFDIIYQCWRLGGCAETLDRHRQLNQAGMEKEACGCGRLSIYKTQSGAQISNRYWFGITELNNSLIEKCIKHQGLLSKTFCLWLETLWKLPSMSDEHFFWLALFRHRVMAW